jgi:hypothetical protein
VEVVVPCSLGSSTGVSAPADFVPTGRDKPAYQCRSDGCSDRDDDAEVSEEIAVDQHG